LEKAKEEIVWTLDVNGPGMHREDLIRRTRIYDPMMKEALRSLEAENRIDIMGSYYWRRH